MDKQTSDKDIVLGLAKGLTIIAGFSAERPRLTSSEAASIAGITRAAARRSLLTLVKLGFARFDDKYFYLQPKILRLGYNYLSSLKLPELVQPALDEISRDTDESSSAATLDETDVLYIARSARRRLMAIDIGVGTRLPAFCTSLGRVLLANGSPERVDDYFRNAKLYKSTPKTVDNEITLRAILEKVAKQGYCLVDEELELGLRSLSVPFFNRNGLCVCAVNVSVAASRLSATKMVETLLPVMLKHRDEVDYI